MDIPQLMGIADQLGVKVSPNDEHETVVYSILDKAAEETAANAATAPKRKRTRIVKKDTNKVYTVNGKEGENFDVKNRHGKTTEKPASLFGELPVSNDTETTAESIAEETASTENTEPQEKTTPKRRGRKPKDEQEETAAESEQTEKKRKTPLSKKPQKPLTTTTTRKPLFPKPNFPMMRQTTTTTSDFWNNYRKSCQSIIRTKKKTIPPLPYGKETRETVPTSSP